MEKIAPLLRWAGSKRQLVSRLSCFWDDSFERYVEPFLGSGCLFFHLQPRRALLGDLNGELIQTYQQVKNRPEEVSRALRRMPLGPRSFYRVRRLQPAALNRVQRAARFIYLNRFCFNGLYRTNLQGEFNVPYGGAKSGGLPSQGALLEASKLLHRASLKPVDFESLLRRVTSGDFVYMDPPFSVRKYRVFKEYDRSVFDHNDVVRLRRTMESLADSKISFVVSYLESDEADFLCRGFKVSPVTVRRNISGFLRSRASCRELLISYGP